MPTAQWMEQVHAVPVPTIMAAAGLELIGKRWSPCPACGAERGSSHERRGAVKPTTDGHGWCCVACQGKGDGLDFIAFHLFQSRLSELEPQDRWKVREWSAQHGWCRPFERRESPMDAVPNPFSDNDVDQQPPPPEPEEIHGGPPTPSYPPQAEVEALWSACLPIRKLSEVDSPDDAVAKFVSSRSWDIDRLNKLDVVRVTPHPDHYAWPTWWPRGRAFKWRLVTRAFSPEDGSLRSLHARAVVPVEKGVPKTLWPKDYDAAGLVMCDEGGSYILKGEATNGHSIHTLLVGEGITDLVSMSLRVRTLHGAAVISCTNGSFKSLQHITPHLSIWTKVYIATDGDGPGMRYADEVATALSPVPVRRLPIASFRS